VAVRLPYPRQPLLRGLRVAYHMAMPCGRRNLLMPAFDGKSMSVPQYCNRIPGDPGEGAFAGRLNAPATLPTGRRAAGTVPT